MMNLSHSRPTDWGLQLVRIENNFRILDVGCGGGRLILLLSIQWRLLCDMILPC
jgi:2-polyprenyl-3-methyl-5-hydroxy-6-metoxy-1,4-benzoquinol methylase